MTELQERELEILRNFIDVCERLNLKYFLVCGSALGAIKYGGFIPWDDDIDVAMPREDYNVFTEKAKDLLPQNIFIQTFKTDPFFPKHFCKLRDSDTTYVEIPYKNIKMNHGVFIDVFPLDGFPDRKYKQIIFKLRLRDYIRKTSVTLDIERSKKGIFLNNVYRLLNYQKRTNIILEKLEKLLCKTSKYYGQSFCNYGNFRGDFIVNNKSVYGEGKVVDFEGIKVIIPKEYNVYLTQLYGDYTLEPPIEEQKGHHYYDIIDLANSYKKHTLFE